MLDQIIKGHYIALHNTALLAKENANLREANEKVVKKRSRSTRQVPCEEGLTVEEVSQVDEQLNQPVEGDGVVSPRQGELPSQANPPPARAPPRYSGCRQISHRINIYKNRYI
jgi:hypothetical protein